MHTMKKHGDFQAKKDYAHILGWGDINAIETHVRGRPKGAESRQRLAKILNCNANLRLKSQHGNR